MEEDTTQERPAARRFRYNWWRIVRWGGIGIVAGLLAIQLIPYGRAHNNPPVTQAVVWDSPRTAELWDRACADCHSNETEWPWYTNVAPISWLVQNHVDEGRAHLNVSEWDKPHRETDEAAGTVRRGSMPPSSYTYMHRDAVLSAQEKQDLIDGLNATLGSD